MDCDSEKYQEESRKKFLKAKTVKKFMKEWAKFYKNKNCIPTYSSNFVGGEDNPEATFELGEKLYSIARKGILSVDSQVTIPGSQKGYILSFVHKDLASRLAEELNRYTDIVAYYNYIGKEDKMENGEQSLYVTYDALDPIIEQGAKEGKMLGKPYTRLGFIDGESLEMIQEWMSEPVKRIINRNNYVYFVIINPSFSSPPEYVFDVLLKVLA